VGVLVCLFVCLFFCLFVVVKPKNIYFASCPGIEVKPLEFIHSGRIALPAVLPEVHHRPETLYVPTVELRSTLHMPS